MTRNTSMQTHSWDSALAPDISPLFLALQWAHQRSLTAMQPILDKFHLSAAEFDVLATLRNAPAPHQMTPAQIQYQVVITSGGLTKVMQQLTERGLVERSQSQDDLRVKPVRLSASGQQTIEAAMQAMLEVNGQWIRGALAAEEITQLIQLLRKTVEADPTEAQASLAEPPQTTKKDRRR
jgi:DNA-binding MarR family transcriptional regulator